jgi:hypothetical protein
VAIISCFRIFEFRSLSWTASSFSDFGCLSGSSPMFVSYRSVKLSPESRLRLIRCRPEAQCRIFGLHL